MDDPYVSVSSDGAAEVGADDANVADTTQLDDGDVVALINLADPDR